MRKYIVRSHQDCGSFVRAGRYQFCRKVVGLNLLVCHRSKRILHLVHSWQGFHCFSDGHPSEAFSNLRPTLFLFGDGQRAEETYPSRTGSICVSQQLDVLISYELRVTCSCILQTYRREACLSARLVPSRQSVLTFFSMFLAKYLHTWGYEKRFAVGKLS